MKEKKTHSNQPIKSPALPELEWQALHQDWESIGNPGLLL
jgi:hypothetical protein